jgi:hypothetical protein
MLYKGVVGSESCLEVSLDLLRTYSVFIAPNNVVQTITFDCVFLQASAKILGRGPHSCQGVRVYILNSFSDAFGYSRVVDYTDDAALLSRDHFAPLPFVVLHAALRWR